jgi:hypothetical protein
MRSCVCIKQRERSASDQSKSYVQESIARVATASFGVHGYGDRFEIQPPISLYPHHRPYWCRVTKSRHEVTFNLTHVVRRIELEQTQVD